MIVEVNGLRFYMEGYMKVNLDTAKTTIKKDWDMVLVYDGQEGSGKSTKAMQDAKYCDPTLDIDRIVFTPYEFRKAILNAKPYQAVVYDEAYTGLSSRATMSQINRALVSMLAEIRQKNLFIFVVMPTFFDLDKYVALWRSRALIHVYTGKNFQRGFFGFYNIDRKKELYVKGKKFYNYFVAKPNFRGRFTNVYIVDKQAYRKKKKESLTAREKKKEEEEITRQINDGMFIRIMDLSEKSRQKVPNWILAEILGISETHFYRKVKQYHEMRDLV